VRGSVRSPRHLRMRPTDGWNACRSLSAGQGDLTKLVAANWCGRHGAIEADS
jgi:hypothetical protein